MVSNKSLENKLDKLISTMERIAVPIPAIPAIPPIPPIPAIPPIPPIMPLHIGDHDLIVGLVKDVGTLQITVDKIVAREDTHVTMTDFNNHVESIVQLTSKLDARTTILEVATTKLMAWGSAVLVFSGILEAVIFHFWK